MSTLESALIKSKKIIGLFILVLIFFLFVTVIWINRPKLAGIEVDSNLTGDVIINGKKVGRTPYSGATNVGEVTVQLLSYQTRVDLVPGIKTVIRRDFDKDGKESLSGEIISFEKNNGNASLSVITNPLSAQVILDGVPKGFSPIKIDNVLSGTHKLEVAADGYLARTSLINLVDGYKLIASIDLARNLSLTNPTPAPITSTQKEKWVEVLSTPTGFLRVRDKPETNADEIGQVKPGEKYKLLAVDEKGQWYEIQFTATSAGWISNTYATTSSEFKK